jgi:hypothetical protein
LAQVGGVANADFERIGEPASSVLRPLAVSAQGNLVPGAMDFRNTAAMGVSIQPRRRI